MDILNEGVNIIAICIIYRYTFPPLLGILVLHENISSEKPIYIRILVFGSFYKEHF